MQNNVLRGVKRQSETRREKCTLKIVELMKIKQEDNMNNRGVTIAFLGDSVTQGCFEFCKKNKDVYTVFDKNSAYMEAVKDICYKNNVVVCDCYSKWKVMKEIGIDTTELLANKINHPTREMNWLFAIMLVDIMIEK